MGEFHSPSSLSPCGRGMWRLGSLLPSRSWERGRVATLRRAPSQDLLGGKPPSQVFLSRKGREIIRQSLRPISSFIISFVPPKMRVTRAARQARALGYSFTIGHASSREREYQYVSISAGALT